MKRTLITMTALAMLTASTPLVRAHDGGWSTAGKVLTGVGAGLLLSRALEPQPVYTTPVYVNPAPVVVQQPATVVVQQPVQTVVQQPAQQVVVQQPATVVTQPVVVQQPAIIYQPAPVIYAPAPVVYPAPVYYRPAYCGPVIGFRFSFGGPHYHHRHW
jgi:hypothetical protein